MSDNNIRRRHCERVGRDLDFSPSVAKPRVKTLVHRIWWLTVIDYPGRLTPIVDTGLGAGPVASLVVCALGWPLGGIMAVGKDEARGASE